MGHDLWEAIAVLLHAAPDDIPGKWALAGAVGVGCGVVALAALMRAGVHMTEEERDEQYATEYRVRSTAQRELA